MSLVSILPELGELYPIHSVKYLEDVVIDYNKSLGPSDEAFPLTSDGSEHDLELIITGLPEYVDDKYPLDRVSDKRWEYPARIELFDQGSTSGPCLTVVVRSDSLGYVGSVQLSEDLIGCLGESRTVTLINGTSESQFSMSFSVRPFVPRTIEERNASGIKMSWADAGDDGIDFTEASNNPGNPITALNIEIMSMVDDVVEDRQTGAATLDECIDRLKTLSRKSIGLYCRPAALNLLVESYFHRFCASCRVEDISRSIACQELQIGLMVNDPTYSDCGVEGLMHIHAHKLLGRFASTKDIQDIEGAIGIHRVKFKIPNGIETTDGWYEFARALLFRSQWFTPRLEDLNDAVDGYNAALRLYSTQGDPGVSVSRPDVLGPLAQVSALRLQVTQYREHLVTTAISTLWKERDAIPTTDKWCGVLLSCLSSALHRQWTYTLDLSQLNDAIACHQKAIRALPRGCIPRTAALWYLSQDLESLYHRTRAIGQMETSVRTMQQALDEAPVGDPNIPLLRADLAARLSVLYGATGRQEHIKRAISIQEEVNETLPAELARYMPEMLTRLGERYCSLAGSESDENKGSVKAEHCQSAIDLFNKSISCAKSLGQSNHNTRAFLGESYLMRFSATKNRDDLDASISILQELAEELSDDYTLMKFGAMKSLGFALKERFALLGDKADLDRAISVASQLARTAGADIVHRYSGASVWASCVLMTGKTEESLEAFDTAMELFTVLADTGEMVRQKHSDELSERQSKVVRGGVMAAIEVGRVDKALEYLQKGCGLVWTYLSNLRTPLDELRVADKALSERFEAVCRRLEIAGVSVSTLSVVDKSEDHLDREHQSHQESTERRKLSIERDSVLETIRSTVPGFKGFLRPLSCTTLLENLPISGWIVIVNIQITRCDAIVLHNRQAPLHIPLPELSLKQSENLRKLLHSNLVSNDLRAIKPASEVARRPVSTMPVIEYVLKQLWIGVAQPIINALDLQPSSTELPRVWWHPTGPLTSLPLHAAGIYRGEGACSLSDYVVSSYIPTLSALTQRVKRKANTPSKQNGVFLVSVPSARGASFIPGTETEVKIVETALEDAGVRCLHVGGEDATVETAIEAIEKSSCLHFASHAYQNKYEPLRSGFLFRDGRRLELSTIIKLNLKFADVAFLSACQTSTGDETLSEEAMHLAAGMLAAGFRGVVSTMWSIRDKYAPEVADTYYKHLLSQATTMLCARIDGENAAQSLHYSVKKLRERIGVSEDAMLSWVPYVHFGF